MRQIVDEETRHAGTGQEPKQLPGRQRHLQASWLRPRQLFVVSAWRVGLFTEVYRPIQNGVVASVDALAHTLRARGHNATIVAPAMPGSGVAQDLVRLPSLPLPTRTAYRLTIPYLPRAVRTLSIVHAHSPFVTGALGAWHARRGRIPLVFTYHTQLEAYAHYVPFDARLTRGAAALLTRTYANVADIVVVPTTAMERRLRDLGVCVPISIVPSGIDVATFACGRRRDDVRARFGVGPREKLVLAVGRLGREKNVELALEAFARANISSARLVLVGDGIYRGALEARARQLGITPRTTFARELPRDALPDAYASADAFLFASRSETQGLVLVEALAAGLPIVAVDTPQTRDVVGAWGVFAAADARELAAALGRVLDGASPAREGGRRRAWDFDAARCGERMLDVYAAAFERRRRSPALRGAVASLH